jgi:SAM-dependent methyltransferase
MTHEEKITRWIGTSKIGVEIGPGSTPVPGLTPAPFYVDCFKDFGGMECLADYYGHACALPFHDHSLDYVIASHVLEHVANPIAALAEWYRVLRPGGVIYLIIPDRRYTWDRHRALTPVAHFLADYEAGTTAADPTHIEDFVNDVEWSEWCPSIPTAEVPAKKIEIAQILHAQVARGEEINLHFHTFEPSNVRALLETLTSPAVRNRETDSDAVTDSDFQNGSDASRTQPARRRVPRFNWEILEMEERFPTQNPNGVLAILRVHKGWRARADAEAFRIRSGGERRAVVRDDAIPFTEWAAKMSSVAGVS